MNTKRSIYTVIFFCFDIDGPIEKVVRIDGLNAPLTARTTTGFFLYVVYILTLKVLKIGVEFIANSLMCILSKNEYVVFIKADVIL